MTSHILKPCFRYGRWFVVLHLRTFSDIPKTFIRSHGEGGGSSHICARHLPLPSSEAAIRCCVRRKNVSCRGTSSSVSRCLSCAAVCSRTWARSPHDALARDHLRRVKHSVHDQLSCHATAVYIQCPWVLFV